MDDIIQEAKDFFHHDQEHLDIQVLEERKGFFGFGAYISAKVTLMIDPIEEGKKYLLTLINSLNLNGDITIETQGKSIIYNLTSDNNGYLIGKNGKTLQSFQTLTQQVVSRYSDTSLKVIVDVDFYRKKQHQRLEALAKKVATEVRQTKIPAKLDPMNAYERRLIHQTLSSWGQIKTVSEGVEPNRYLIIKYKK